MPEAAHPFVAGGVGYVLPIRKVMLTRTVSYLIMNPQRRSSRADSAGDTAISRRRLLAASGVVAFGGLSGCLDRVASTATNTGASPAAVFAGERSDGSDGPLYHGDGFSLSEPRVTRLTPALRVGSGSLSGDVELEGWVTATTLMAQNHNSSRSNRSQPAAAEIDTDGDDDSDGDGVSDGTEGIRANYNNSRSNHSGVRPPDILDDDLDEDNETFRAVSRLNTQLQEATASAWAAISKRSARTGRNPELDREVSAALESMAGTLSEMRAELERCSDDVCRMALENVGAREADVRQAQEYAAEGEWAAFGVTDEDAAILVGEYLAPPIIFDAPGTSTLGERAELFRYLDVESVVAERFTVCLPDAEVPGGNGSIREAVTPQRFLDYITGRAEPIDGVPLVFDLGAAPDADGDSGCVVHDGEVVCWSPHLSAAISDPVSTGGSLEVIREGAETVVVSDHRTPPGLARVCERAGADGSCGEGVWTRPSLPSSGSGVSVFQVMVQPPECPHPFPALLYVQQCRNDDQLIYTGGWIIDDAALYERATTVLTMREATAVVGIDLDDMDSDSDGDGFGDVVEAEMRRSRAYVRYNARGASPTGGTVGELVEVGVLSRETLEGDEYGFVTNIDLTAPILHLANAGSASNEVKFKAGAELSGQVN